MDIQDLSVFLSKMCVLGKFVIYQLHFLLGIYQVTQSFQYEFTSLIHVRAQMSKSRHKELEQGFLQGVRARIAIEFMALNVQLPFAMLMFSTFPESVSPVKMGKDVCLSH